VDEVVLGALHGSQYTSDDFQQEIAEWFVKVLKEDLLWVRSLDAVQQRREALLEFQDHFHNRWIMSKYGYKTPARIHREKRTCSEAAA